MKLLLCIALHLYHGPVDANTPVTVLAEECKAVSYEKARKAIAACAAKPAKPATECEVLGPVNGRMIIEWKIEGTP